MRATFYQDSNMKFDLEEYEGCVFFHITVHKWNKSIYKQCIDLFVDATDVCKAAGYNTVYILLNDNFMQTMKFAMLFGFDVLVYCEKNESVLLYQEI